MPADFAKVGPSQVLSLAGYISLRVMAHTARTLIRPGGCPYCWYALFKEQ